MHFSPARWRARQQARRPHHSELSAALDASDGACFLTKAASMALPPTGLDLDLDLDLSLPSARFRLSSSCAMRGPHRGRLDRARGGQLFEIPAGAKLGNPREAGRRAAATRGRSRYDPDDEAAVGKLAFANTSARDLRFSSRAIQQGNVGLLGTQNRITRSVARRVKTPDSS